MAVIEVTEEERHGDRIRVESCDLLDDAFDLASCEFVDDTAAGDPLGHLDTVARRHELLGPILAQVVCVGSGPGAIRQDVTEALGGEKDHAGQSVVDDGIGCNGRTVKDQANVFERESLTTEVPKCFEQAPRGILGGRRDLDREPATLPVVGYCVGKGATDIDGDGPGHARRLRPARPSRCRPCPRRPVRDDCS